MSFKNLAKRVLRPIAKPVLDAIAARAADRARREGVEGTVEFELRLLTTLRSLTTRSDHRVLLPHDSARPCQNLKEVKVGFFGNIANNAYNFTKCLRRLGYDAELVVEDRWFDAFLMNRPFWEDLEVECDAYEDGLRHEHQWVQPYYVRRVGYDPQMQSQFQGRYSAIPEVQALYKKAFGLELPADRALLLAQQMGHWPYLLAMNRYDVIQFSGAPISMGVFCPKPYVVFPTGSDLFIAPFEETPLGLLMRAAYQSAGHLLFCETNYPDYLDRLALPAPRSFAPLMVDTDTYAPGKSEDVRAQWMKDSGGKRFILGVCRQSWEWKGNDRLIRAFAGFMKKQGNGEWRLVLMKWGPDTEKTGQLVAELGLERLVRWERLLSKPLLRKRQQAADLVVDQFVMPGYGTSVLESMAAGRVVMMAPPEEHSDRYLRELPPFIRACRPEEICKGLEQVSDGRVREKGEVASLEWVRRYHGYGSVISTYLDGYRSALRRSARVSL